MNRLNHTPGPWHTQGCTIYAAGNRIAQTWDTCDDFPTPEMEADARLIASAPQMLLALELGVALVSNIEENDILTEYEREFLDYARSIISKAKGEA